MRRIVQYVAYKTRTQDAYRLRTRGKTFFGDTNKYQVMRFSKIAEQHESCSTGLPVRPHYSAGAYFLSRQLILFHHIFATFSIYLFFLLKINSFFIHLARNNKYCQYNRVSMDILSQMAVVHVQATLQRPLPLVQIL